MTESNLKIMTRSYWRFEKVNSTFPDQQGTRAPDWSCLVVSARGDRQAMIAQAALLAGWQPTVCGEAAAAERCADQWVHRLAVVDLPAGKAAATAFQRLVERLTEISPALLVVCGPADDPRQEVWARQFGVWMYLPGLDAETDLSSLFQAATRAVGRTSLGRKRTANRPPPWAGRATWRTAGQSFKKPPQD